jgi:hypothetical protein
VRGIFITACDKRQFLEWGTQGPCHSERRISRTFLTFSISAHQPNPVISNAVRNLVPLHPNTTFSAPYLLSCSRNGRERGSSGVEDEISHFVRNDRVGAWYAMSKGQTGATDPSLRSGEQVVLGPYYPTWAHSLGLWHRECYYLPCPCRVRLVGNPGMVQCCKRHIDRYAIISL